MPIRELPKSVSSKIAAGEVVERPVSVVKELIENSIDAGATEIRVRVKGAGRILIEVEDNGEGIAASDTQLAVMRYATSKIYKITDLENIKSLGFRGEALASIASVSRLRIDTRSVLENEGISILLEGGEQKDEMRIGKKQGTKVTVENLFFNVPARQKFLKKDITEKRLIIELVSRYSLYYGHIRFSLDLDDRQVLTTYGRGDLREILIEIYDLRTARGLLEVYYQDPQIEVNGFTSPASQTRSNRKEIVFFVNGRLVTDPTLTSAVLRAYHGFLMTGRYPITILFIQIEPEEIDVNVHPTKAEIRFRDQGRVFSAIHSALRKTISAFSPVPIFSPDLWSNTPSPENTLDPVWRFNQQDIANNEITAYPQSELNEQPPIIGKVPLLRLIGQVGRMYIAAEGPDGLYLIDQHSAHERILYEQLTIKKNGKTTSQMLINPAVIHLNHPLRESFVEKKDILEAIGFNLEEFGPDTIRVIAIPVQIQNMNPEEAIFGALEADEEDHNLVGQAEETRIISRICKRVAVKGGQILSSLEQEKLIRDLEDCESPRTCPHGRPTMIHLSVDLLARQFGRLGSR